MNRLKKFVLLIFIFFSMSFLLYCLFFPDNAKQPQDIVHELKI